MKDYSTPLSRLADKLRIKRNNPPTERLVDETCTAASRELDKISNKLSGATRFSIAMAQELQEIIGEAETADCKNPFPAIKGRANAIRAAKNIINSNTALRIARNRAMK